METPPRAHSDQLDSPDVGNGRGGAVNALPATSVLLHSPNAIRGANTALMESAAAADSSALPAGSLPTSGQAACGRPRFFDASSGKHKTMGGSDADSGSTSSDDENAGDPASGGSHFVSAADMETPLTQAVPPTVSSLDSSASPRLMNGSGRGSGAALLGVPSAAAAGGQRSSSICVATDEHLSPRTPSDGQTGTSYAEVGAARSPRARPSTAASGAASTSDVSSPRGLEPGALDVHGPGGRPFAPEPPKAAPVDAWAPIYSTMPRFGFPPSAAPHVAQAETAFLRSHAMQQQTTACEQQWGQVLRGLQMLAHAVPAEMVPLRRLCRKFGVPAHVRGIVWITLSGVASKMEENEGFCNALLERCGMVTGHEAEEIEKDLMRTFPDHPLFTEESQGMTRLRRVLHALCWRNPLTGYCQGFNFIAGVLLLFLDDEEAAFWASCFVLEQLLPNDYFAANLIGMRTDQCVLGDMLRAHLPKLAAHFDRVGFDVGVLVPSWLMTLFLTVLPVTASVPVWDYLLTREPAAEPSCQPLACCVALLKIHADAMLSMDDPGEMLVALTRLTQSTCDGMRIVRTAHELKVVPATVRALRRKHRSRLALEAAARATELRRAQSAARITNLQRSAAAEALRARERDADGGALGSMNGEGAGVPAASPDHRPPRITGSRAKDSFFSSPFVAMTALRPRSESIRGPSAARTFGNRSGLSETHDSDEDPEADALPLEEMADVPRRSGAS